jgi:hypothetical protein
MNGTSDYEVIKRLGYDFEPAPRSNPDGSLYGSWRIVDRQTSKTVLRGSSRDSLEEKMHRWLDSAVLVRDPERVKKLGVTTLGDSFK